MDYNNIKAPYLPYESIRGIVDSFLGRHHSKDKIPVDIEFIIESKMGIDIIPIPLKRPFDIEAVTSKDRSEISIDIHTLENYIPRARFSLAHEVGHIILHEEMFNEIDYESPEDFTKAQDLIPSNQYGWFERQANNFAGLVLVPDGLLEQEVEKAVKMYINQGYEITDKTHDLVYDYIPSYLNKKFNTSSMVIKIRMDKNNIDLRDFT